MRNADPSTYESPAYQHSLARKSPTDRGTFFIYVLGSATLAVQLGTAADATQLARHPAVKRTRATGRPATTRAVGETLLSAGPLWHESSKL
jgi:hypothetical protein